MRQFRLTLRVMSAEAVQRAFPEELMPTEDTLPSCSARMNTGGLPGAAVVSQALQEWSLYPTNMSRPDREKHTAHTTIEQ
jgi:hypothetical protein